MLAAEAERRLAAAGVGPRSAGVEARRIVERASGNEGAELRAGPRRARPPSGASHFFDVDARAAPHRRAAPVRRSGAGAFRTLDLLVDRRVLIPRPETEVVAGLALDELDRMRAGAEAAGRPLTVVDLGTGSGAIALSVAAERDRVDVWLTDASADALAVARANLAGLGRAATRVRIAEGAWFAALPPELAGADRRRRLATRPTSPPATSCPPVVRDWEPPSALFAGADGLDDLRVLVAEAPRLARPRRRAGARAGALAGRARRRAGARARLRRGRRAARPQRS